MKKIVVFAFTALLSLLSCSSDDSVNVSEEKLAKKWYHKSSQANGSTEAYEHMPCGKDYIEFLADGTYKEFYINECEPTVSGESIGNWVLEGNTVSVAIEGESYGGKITKLSDTVLQITFVADYDDDGDEENVRVNFTSN